MNFTHEVEKNNCLAFLDVLVLQQAEVAWNATQKASFQLSFAVTEALDPQLYLW